MRHFLSKNLLLVFFAIIPSFAYCQDPDFHIYLLFGQSNMEGAGTIESQDRTGVDERVQVMGAVTCTGNNTSFTLGKWRTAHHPSFVAGPALELVITSGEQWLKIFRNISG